MPTYQTAVALFILFCLSVPTSAEDPKPLTFTVKVETLLKQDGEDFLWYHPRAASLPADPSPRW